MSTTFAINGFGRIGRLAVRVWYQKHRSQLKLGAINTSGSMPLASWVHLLKYDTAHGLFDPDLSFEEHQTNKQVTDQDPLLGYLYLDDFKIPVLAQRDPKKIPWANYNVDLVIEATGVFRTEDLAKQHLHSQGAKRVLLAAPGKGGQTETHVIGVSSDLGQGPIYSNASCTTNCISPVVHVLETSFGIDKALMTTIHAYTDDQRLQDGSHRDLRRARAAAQNIIPTTTGAALATTQVVPSLQDKFDGLAIRVPVITGSLSDLTFVLKQKVTKDQVNQALIQASQTNLKGILAVTDEPLVSSDIIGRPESSIVDLNLTQVIGGNLVKVIAWYDNEWGFTNRLLELISLLLNS